ncbi:MAG: ATP-binding protein [Clostridiales Family XIII bacterium]|jgi:predicted AAA+ superfamily ATPase|nr:ATP-binding protein [Clostridiales Family XIII bacterium]
MNTIKYIDQLILFEAIRNDDIASRLAGVSHDTTETTLEEAIRGVYFTTQRALLGNIGNGEISGNYLQDHLCRVIAGEENIFARMSEKGVYKDLRRGMAAAEITAALDFEAKSVLMLAASEIKLISGVYRFDFIKITGAADGRNVAAAPISGSGALSRREQVHKAMMQSKSIDAAIMLANYYQSYGSGIFETAPALYAEDEGLVPVKCPDPITMDDLIGYESQKRMLIDNANILMSGTQANNMLLYGDSGTGKSSSAKALLNLYSAQGLKMISVAKDKINLIPGILAQIEGRGMKFIIFIDDLSFEENENEYKVFKSIMEGRIIPRPKNTIFIVTTNRKNIVKEVWNDRNDEDDVRRRDNIQEKRSLSDRFGITLIYSAPDQNEYLAIVKSMAGKAGLHLPVDELAAEALKWEIRHGGRSGRTARQFVDYKIGIERIR